MQGMLTGFAAIAGVIAVGYVLGRRGILGDDAGTLLTRLAIDVASPALLFTTLARADPSAVLSERILITALGTAATAAVFTVIGVLRGWDAGRTAIGALCSCYVNAGNLGIPIALYVLGDATVVAPVLLFQQIVLTPVAVTMLDLARPGQSSSPWRRLTIPLRSPMTLGSLSGVAVAAAGWTLPSPVLAPLTLLGNLAVPAVLLAFGISLCGSALPGRGADRLPMVLCVTLKCVVQPLVVWALATGVFRLTGPALLDVVLPAALPAAQNMFAFASRYRVAERLARESVLLSTVASVPVLFAVAALLG
jgi:malonate transporter and related proteins